MTRKLLSVPTFILPLAASLLLVSACALLPADNVPAPRVETEEQRLQRLANQEIASSLARQLEAESAAQVESQRQQALKEEAEKALARARMEKQAGNTDAAQEAELKRKEALQKAREAKEAGAAAKRLADAEKRRQQAEKKLLAAEKKRLAAEERKRLAALEREARKMLRNSSRESHAFVAVNELRTEYRIVRDSDNAADAIREARAHSAGTWKIALESRKPGYGAMYCLSTYGGHQPAYFPTEGHSSSVVALTKAKSLAAKAANVAHPPRSVLFCGIWSNK